MHSKASGKEI